MGSSQLNLKCQNKTEKNIIKNNTTIKSIKQKNEKIEEKSNLNLTPHTTVFHQFPIEAMIGPGTELALKQYSVFQEINSFKCLSLLYLSALLRGLATNMVCATPSVSSSIRRFYACNAPPLPPSPISAPPLFLQKVRCPPLLMLSRARTLHYILESLKINVNFFSTSSPQTKKIFLI